MGKNGQSSVAQGANIAPSFFHLHRVMGDTTYAIPVYGSMHIHAWYNMQHVWGVVLAYIYHASLLWTEKSGKMSKKHGQKHLSRVCLLSLLIS
jgi:hypothetical protein